jgi:hypothetical protein
MIGARRRRAIVVAGILSIAVTSAIPRDVAAQVQRPVAPDSAKTPFDPELRLDAIIARISAAQVGAGFTMVTGLYVRSGIVGAVGASRHGLSGRIDGFTRFHFDPFRQSRWAPYGGGGLSGRFDEGEKPRAYLLVLLGLDGPIHHGMTSSFELGLGGGARAGVTLRRATTERR